jgi:large exoprotein involved in heme utilization and adhesion
LRFKDGTVFSADPAAVSVLSVAAPESFGFLRANPAGVSILKSTLQVPAGKTLSAVGGDITVISGALSAPSGQVHLTSVAAAAEVPLSPNGAPVASGGNVTLTGSLLDTSGDGGGTVRIRGGRIVLDQSLLLASTLGTRDGAAIGVALAGGEEIRVTNGSAITTDVRHAGRAGDIVLTADRVEVSNAALISARAFPGTTGAGGEVKITAGALAVTDGAQVSTATAGTGRGNVTIAATTIDVESSAIQAATFGKGTAGNIVIAVDRLSLRGGGGISSSSARDGAAGDITM